MPYNKIQTIATCAENIYHEVSFEKEILTIVNAYLCGYK